MSLSSCPECWEDLCVCGYKYKTMDKTARIEIAAAALGVEDSWLKEFLGNKIPEKHPRSEES